MRQITKYLIKVLGNTFKRVYFQWSWRPSILQLCCVFIYPHYKKWNIITKFLSWNSIYRRTITPVTKISISSTKLSESALTTHLETLDCIGGWHGNFRDYRVQTMTSEFRQCQLMKCPFWQLCYSQKSLSPGSAVT